jgi:dihydropteroate synthase
VPLPADVVPDTPPGGFAHPHAARVLEVKPLEGISLEPAAVGVLGRKGRVYAIRVDEVPPPAAPVLRQSLLAVGGECTAAEGLSDPGPAATSAILLATWDQYDRLLPALVGQPHDVGAIAAEVGRALDAYRRHGPRELVGAHASLTLGDRPRVMGIVNVTPDSFSDGGKFLDPPAAAAHAERLVAEGADVIDVGGESTRPGASPVSPDAEWRRVEPVLRELAGKIRVPVSIDTRHPEVARQAVDAGVDIVNDVEGLRSEAMRRTVARSGAAAVVMHMRGTPGTMQSDLRYADLRDEVFRWLAERTDAALAEGIGPERLVVDPGIGFGKSAAQSLELLTHVGEFRSLGYPVLLGASRKSFLGWAMGSKRRIDRLEAGIAAAVIAAEQGVELVRTHDVAPTVRALMVGVAARRAVASRDADEEDPSPDEAKP